MSRGAEANERKRRMSEQKFIEKWWKNRFPTADKPTWSSAITCVDAIDLMAKYKNYLRRKP